MSDKEKKVSILQHLIQSSTIAVLLRLLHKFYPNLTLTQSLCFTSILSMFSIGHHQEGESRIMVMLECWERIPDEQWRGQIASYTRSSTLDGANGCINL